MARLNPVAVASNLLRLRTALAKASACNTGLPPLASRPEVDLCKSSRPTLALSICLWYLIDSFSAFANAGEAALSVCCSSLFSALSWPKAAWLASPTPSRFSSASLTPW